MIRPRLRPTVSRRIKYLGVAPTAEKKLGREARRGSHDLRRLVGHANFLDVLVENLDIHAEDDEDGDFSPDLKPTAAPAAGNARQQTEEEEGSSDNSSDGEYDSDEWSDSSDDDDHELVRTASGRSAADIASARSEIQQSLAQADDHTDYFSRSQHGENQIKLNDVSQFMSATQNGDNERKDRSVNVTVISSPSSPMEGFGYEGEPQPTSLSYANVRKEGRSIEQGLFDQL